MSSRKHSDAKILRLGIITLVVMGLIMAAAFNLSKFPGFGGTSYTAMFKDANGLHRGNMVQIGGIRVGRVQEVSLKGSSVEVKFEVDHGVDFGKDSSASVQVLNLLGEKYLEIDPAGPGQLASDTPIPLTRTHGVYDIVDVFGDLTATTEAIDKSSLKSAFDVLSQTVDASAPQIRQSFEGISRLSRTVASRDADLQRLLRSSTSVSKVLAARSHDLVKLMGNADLVFKEVRKRKRAIHLLLVNARTMAVQLRGLATDNQRQIQPALSELNDLLGTLRGKQKELKATLAALGPYTSILSNIIGTGPWFDAYAVNLLAIPSGEFLPGSGPQ